MKKAVNNLAIALILMLVGAMVSYFPLKRHFQAELEGLKPKVDTLLICDTITQIKPVFVERRILETDTLKIAVVDVIEKTDTIYLPREQRVYQDSTYRAVVSGIEPSLDSISVYQKTIEITKIATRKEWRKFDYGIQAGVGLVYPVNNSPTFGGYVGIGVTYHF